MECESKNTYTFDKTNVLQHAIDADTINIEKNRIEIKKKNNEIKQTNENNNNIYEKKKIKSMTKRYTNEKLVFFLFS